MVNPNGDNLIFLISQPRSGSTLLQRILAGSPDIHTCSEPWIMLPMLAPFSDDPGPRVYDLDLTKTAIHEFCGEDAYCQAMATAAAKLYSSRLNGSGKTRFLDKTPRYYEIANRLRTTFPHAKFITLYRNPLSVLASILSTWVWEDLERLPGFNRDLMHAPKVLTQPYNSGAVVHYERLIAHPDSVVRYLCFYLGVEYDPQMLQYGSRAKPAGTFGDHKVNDFTAPVATPLETWKRVLAEPDRWVLARAYLLSLGERTLELLGYPQARLLRDLDAIRPAGFNADARLLELAPITEAAFKTT